MKWSVSKDDVEKTGRWLMSGALRELAKIAFWLVVALTLTGSVISIAGDALHLGPPDDSDTSWSVRSGVRVRHDALTGCDYLETSSGGLTARLRSDGHQVCR